MATKYQVSVLPSRQGIWQHELDMLDTAEDAWQKAKELFDKHIDRNSTVQIKIQKVVR